jgi:uncharacterized membrane protein
VDYLLEGSTDPVRLMIGCILILSAIFALTRTIVNENTNNIDSVVIEEQKNDLLQEDEEISSSNLPRNASFDISKPLVSEEDDEGQEEPAQTNQTRLAFFVLLLAACFSAFWSPLLLIGHRDEEKPTGKSYVALLTFACGEFVALPSVVMSGLHIHRKMTQKKVTLLGMIRELACFRSVAFGLFTGFAISMGYMCYLNAITVLPSTTVFPIVSCNPVVSVIYNVVVLGEFKNSPRSRWLWLFLALVCYGAAIATIATIPKK